VSRGDRITITLDRRKARILWGILDGALDAASGPDGGMTRDEFAVMHPIVYRLCQFTAKARDGEDAAAEAAR
jgi:hypothetical protein